jgi:hypothetical protein
MEAQMVFHEGGHEVVAMVVPFMTTQGQGLLEARAGGLEQVGMELFGDELVLGSLVDQDACRIRRIPRPDISSVASCPRQQGTLRPQVRR